MENLNTEKHEWKHYFKHVWKQQQNCCISNDWIHFLALEEPQTSKIHGISESKGNLITMPRRNNIDMASIFPTTNV